MVKSGSNVKLGRPTKDVKLERILHVRVEPELLDRINAAAAAQGVSASVWLRLTVAAVVDSPGDMARAIATDPGAARSKLVARSRSRSARRAGDGSAA